jgi:preprotein translocase subunit YajC
MLSIITFIIIRSARRPEKKDQNQVENVEKK